MSIVIEGRRIDTKSTAEPFEGLSRERHERDATRGSRMLRDAIWRCLGYAPKADPLPVFKPHKVRLGRPKGTRKSRPINRRIIKLMELSANHHQVSVEALMAPGKGARLVEARQIVMYLARQTTDASYPDIAFHLGGRDHTTIIYGERKVAEKIARVDARTLNALNAIHAEMQA